MTTTGQPRADAGRGAARPSPAPGAASAPAVPRAAAGPQAGSRPRAGPSRSTAAQCWSAAAEATRQGWSRRRRSPRPHPERRCRLPRRRRRARLPARKLARAAAGAGRAGAERAGADPGRAARPRRRGGDGVRRSAPAASRRRWRRDAARRRAHVPGLAARLTGRTHGRRAPMAEIVLDKVNKQYENGFHAVKDLDLDIADGEFLVLVGPSGCGKTTALRMVAGLEDISSGTMRIGDRVVNTMSPRERDIAMVFQSYALYPHMSVADNIAYGLKIRRLDKAEIDRRVKKAADMLELGPLLARKPKQLSGGQRQRVAMGRAIVREPQVFLMDEPLSNLDAKLRVQMRAEISQVQRDLNVTTLYVTHDQTEAMTMGDRVALMKAGVLQQVGNPQFLYDNPDNIFVAGFIGSPPMNMAIARVDRNGDGLTLSLGGAVLELPPAVLAEHPALASYAGRMSRSASAARTWRMPGWCATPRRSPGCGRRSTSPRHSGRRSSCTSRSRLRRWSPRTPRSWRGTRTPTRWRSRTRRKARRSSPRSRPDHASARETRSRSSWTGNGCTSSTRRPAWRSAPEPPATASPR